MALLSPQNVIPDRIAEALRRFPPFSMLPEHDVRSLAVEATVRVMVAGERVWTQGERVGDELLFLARGRVEYFWSVGGRNELVDIRDMGDLLGLTTLLEGEPFRVTAQVTEDSLFYCLPWKVMKRLLDINDAARNYVRRHRFWATRVGGAFTHPPPMSDAPSRTLLQAHLDGARVVRPRPLERLVTCRAHDSVQHAAAIMATRAVPSIVVVDAARRPLGIVTNSNLVRDVVVGGLATTATVEHVMSSPVVTVASGSSATAALLLMLRERIGQVCVTEDGTTATAVLDVCSEKDLLAQSGHHPAGLLREIRLAHSTTRLRELCDEIEAIARGYLEVGVSAIFLGQICAELYDELAQRLIAFAIEALAAEGLTLPTVPWVWLAVGSDGRREQILRTDMDNALVFAGTGSAAGDERARTAFLRFTHHVIEGFVACGFARCQGGVMASNPRWCRSLDEWLAELQLVGAAETNNDLLSVLVLYDLRFVAGTRPLFHELRGGLVDAVVSNIHLQGRFAGAAIDTPPPLNFFGGFVVERKGSREGEFDIKNRALSPLRDAARVLAIKHGLTRRHSTGGRWEELRRHVPRLAEVADLARDGYDLLLRLRTLNGLKRGDSGRFVDPATLSKLERAQLTNVFDVVRLVQDAVRAEFQLQSAR